MFSLFVGAHLILNNYYVTAAEPTRVSSGPQEILSFTTTPHPPARMPSPQTIFSQNLMKAEYYYPHPLPCQQKSFFYFTILISVQRPSRMFNYIAGFFCYC